MTTEQLRSVLDLHAKWLRGEPDGARAYLTGANLAGAYLTGANLAGANLTGADLTDAYLTDACLARANLTGACLARANLTGANLTGANLACANLTGAKGVSLAIAQTRILPEGTLIGWKKALRGEIIKLEIPAHAARSHAFGRKCRASEARVLSIEKGGAPVAYASSNYDSNFRYEVGATVTPKEPFSLDWQDECASGIHFFITREEAEAYSF